MRRFQAEQSLKTLLWNATDLMRKRRDKKQLLDKILVYPVQLESIYVCGSYLKEAEHPNDLDVIVLYRHQSTEEMDLILSLGRAETYRTAVNKLRKATANVDLQIYNADTYNFTVNPFVPNSPPIDKIKKVWDIGNI